MSKIIFKTNDKLFPMVYWQDSQIIVYYFGENACDIEIKETRGIDFEELLLHLDRGGSVFITNKQSEEELVPVENLDLKVDFTSCGRGVAKPQTLF
jgi:hypothetical protein